MIQGNQEKDDLFTQVLNRLRVIQFITNGSVQNDFHNFNVISGIEIDEPGEQGIKSRVLQMKYEFYNV